MANQGYSRRKAERYGNGFLELFEAHSCPSLLVSSKSRKILDANNAALQLFGRSREEFLQWRVQDILEGPTDARVYSSGEEIWVQTHRREDGTEIRVEVVPSSMQLRGQAVTLYVIRDYSRQWAMEMESKKKLARLQHLAHHDALTGLPNRRLVLDRLKHSLDMALRMESHLAVLYVDIDNFKQFNDSFGHQAGDNVLCETALRMRNALRKTDTLARVGGDEFLIILEKILSRDEVIEIIQRLRNALASDISVAGQEVKVTLSIGGSLFPIHATDLNGLLREADRALFLAKERGKDIFFLHD
jgi:diguanylate cyclase (GGDEF)-like protein/PAS domain S-box-containing protein